MRNIRWYTRTGVGNWICYLFCFDYHLEKCHGIFHCVKWHFQHGLQTEHNGHGQM